LSEKRKVVYESAGCSDVELQKVHDHKQFKQIDCDFGELYVIEPGKLRESLPVEMSKLVEERIFEIQNDVQSAPPITYILD
jgi:hypothetical protein